MDLSKSNIPIEKFDGASFPNWQKKVRLCLCMKACGRQLKGQIDDLKVQQLRQQWQHGVAGMIML